MIQVLLIGLVLRHVRPERANMSASIEADPARPQPRKIDRGT